MAISDQELQNALLAVLIGEAIRPEPLVEPARPATRTPRRRSCSTR